jgi:hypothetical protein
MKLNLSNYNLIIASIFISGLSCGIALTTILIKIIR